MSIIGTLNQIKSGEVVLPAIQREFVWTEDQIKGLLDSILRGYPVGIALLWETYEASPYREFIRDYQGGMRPVFKDSAPGQRLQLVLDGQQRLQSLYVAIFGSLDGRQLCFDVLSGRDSDDTSEHKFVFDFAKGDELKEWNGHSKSEMEEPADQREEGFVPYHGVKVSELFAMGPKSREAFIGKLCGDLTLSTEDQMRVRVNLATFDQMLTKDTSVMKLSIIDENLPHDSEERKTYMDVLEIFVRVNTGGTRLNRSDLIFSMLKLNWKESAEELPEFVDRINAGNSLGITTDFVIRCLFAVSDLGARFELDLLRKKSNVEKLRENFESCCQAIEAMVDFVTAHCWVQSSRLMGGSWPLVPLAYYFFRLDRHRIPNSEIAKVRRSFFQLAFSGVLSRWAESRISTLIRQDLKPLADQGANSFPEDRISARVHQWHGHSEIDQHLVWSNVALALHLVQGLNGGAVKHDDNLPEVDHIFPRATLRDEGVEEEMVNHFANFWILARGKNRNKSDKNPSDYFADVPDSEMGRALIPRELLDFAKYGDFIERRSNALVDAIRTKLACPPLANGRAN
ncbi:DUF262 domain-containing protein [Luteolibacter flavescens]|uniref:DUF262 domain-containing protein n=1 Tax=Luteolibacter flavescens TaxID=1859460 RepID=A0ABT3FTS8_9BACT|nr:DUF262 domain-containing protein [Luteolibacter flavescens]MCW1886724.1 DUF262 domain-containing protein [Luteolibacter flavescens]